MVTTRRSLFAVEKEAIASIPNRALKTEPLELVAIGSRVKKYFEGYGWFHGKVQSHNKKKNVYKVRFDDGDTEEYDREELQEILVSSSSTAEEESEEEPEEELPIKKNGRNKRSRCKKAFVIKSEPAVDVFVTDSYQCSGSSSDEDQDSNDDDSNYSVTGEEGKDSSSMEEDYYNDQDDDDDNIIIATLSKKKASINNKVEMVTPKRKASAKSKTTAVATTSAVVTPEASIKKPKTTKESSKAKKATNEPVKTKGGATETKSTAQFKTTRSTSQPKNLVRNIAVRGLPRGALAKCPRTGLTIRTLDGIPPTTNDDSFDPRTSLPGRLMVVKAPAPEAKFSDALEEQIVGKTFQSADDMHQLILQKSTGSKTKYNHRLATYEMEALSDPTFSSWNFVNDRLCSAGLDDGHDDGEAPGPYIVQVYWNENKISGSVKWYTDFKDYQGDPNFQWALLEGDRLKRVPPAVLGVQASLLENHEISMSNWKEELVSDISIISAFGDEMEDSNQIDADESKSGSDSDLLPYPSSVVTKIRLPASLLQKSIRRSSRACSPLPLLEACTELIHPTKVCPGSTFAFLKTLWACMLVDASPFADSHSCLGLEGVLLLSLIAKADPTWTMPPGIRRMVISTALRAAKAESKAWVGFVRRFEDWYQLEKNADACMDDASQHATNLRNIMRVTQAVAGGKIVWGKWNKFLGDSSAAAILAYLNHEEWSGSYLSQPPPLPGDSEKLLIDSWEKGTLGIAAAPSERRLISLDEECRLASIDPSVMPSSLVLLQAVLSNPPTNWKKHGLPALSRQVRKLISEANPRFRERIQLARLQTWGKEKSSSAQSNEKQSDVKHEEQVKIDQNYKTYRDYVTPTGTLSEAEMELMDCFESIQRWQMDRLLNNSQNITPEETSALSSCKNITQNCRITAGPPLSPYDGRIAFLLAFAFAIEIEVLDEVVSAMFCGDRNEPLLVQRIGKARKEGKELATAGGATSGATAVPSLGYVQRDRSAEEAKLMEAAEVAVAEHWRGGKTATLPIPPSGFQWEVGNTSNGFSGWDEMDKVIERTAEFRNVNGKKSWHFTIAGIEVEPFDARAVISPCALDLDDEQHRPIPLGGGSKRDRFLRTALFIDHCVDKKQFSSTSLPYGEPILEAMTELHKLAKKERTSNANEGLVYDWMPLACSSPIPSRTWRDTLLAIRTRDSDHVVLGKGIRQDGSGAPRDMTEGVLVRIFHALECLYPMALRKEGALKFRVRPKGASYHHLLRMLERLGRGEGELSPRSLVLSSDRHSENKFLSSSKASYPTDNKKNAAKRTMNQELVETNNSSPMRKRPRRNAAILSSQKTAIDMKSEAQAPQSVHTTDDSMEVDYIDQFSDKGHTACNFNNNDEEYLPLPEVTTALWDHQEASMKKVVEGVKEGKRGHADASAVGAGKTLTALATIASLAAWIEEIGQSRHGVLIMLPTKALIREWLLEIAAHTKGFHVIEQREDGSLFSLTYAKSHPPIDGNSLVISTLDRVCRHPFIRQTAWDFVVIDECLSVQNADAKRNPSAWRQIEVSMCGVLMLSATFFRSKYDSLFYMIRMLRTPLPRSMEWLPATIHEHIVCQIPETDRKWQMKGEMVPLPAKDLRRYRDIIEAFRRKQLNEPNAADGRKLWIDLESFLRSNYEGRTIRTSYKSSSVMGDAFARVAKGLLRKGRRPLVFADTSTEADFLMGSLRTHGLDARTWANVASQKIAGKQGAKAKGNLVIVAVKSVEGQGINMQHHADAIICRPTPGDHLEQMKGRIDRPGQAVQDLLLHVIVCEHSIEEAKFANIRLAGNFFREYIAPVATRYREKIDLEAALAAGGKGKLKRGTVSGAWRKSLEAAGQSGCFASIDQDSSSNENRDDDADADALNDDSCDETGSIKEVEDEPKYKPLNKVFRNKGDPKAVREAKSRAKKGFASLAVRCWLYPLKADSSQSLQSKGKTKPLAKFSLSRFSNGKPLVLDRKTVEMAVAQLSKNDPKLAALIARIGADALVNDCGTPKPPTQARLFDRCLRAITFTMISVDAGNAFLRRLAIKIGVCLENVSPARRKKLLTEFVCDIKESGDDRSFESPQQLFQLLLDGAHDQITFTPSLVGELVNDCEIIKGKRTGYPHFCGISFPCGKNDDHQVFLEKARAQKNRGKDTVSAGYSAAKASFIISLVQDFKSGKISGEKISKASDRDAAKMLMELKGIGDWAAGQILINFLSRADIMLYGDLTVRNFLNDLYDINHHEASETLVESAADFGDTGPNRDLIDELSKKNGWQPYRSVVCYLMYHLQEDNLVLL